MSYRIGVHGYNPASMNLELIIGQRIGDHAEYITGLGEGTTRVEVREPFEQGPILTIPDEIARGLMDALIQFYGGSTTVQQLRSDYDHERKRVDKMLEALMGQLR